jgi:hypothetical protein
LALDILLNVLLWDQACSECTASKLTDVKIKKVAKVASVAITARAPKSTVVDKRDYWNLKTRVTGTLVKTDCRAETRRTLSSGSDNCLI